MMGPSHRDLHWFEPQPTVGVLMVPSSSRDIRGSESSKAMESHSLCYVQDVLYMSSRIERANSSPIVSDSCPTIIRVRDILATSCQFPVQFELLKPSAE